MPSQKAQKIDLNGDYPCPCRRKGQLVPIALTEAFGCDRCQQIFVVDESGYCLEQLATHYPYKQAWHWTGHQWNRASPGLKAHYLPMALGMLLVSISDLVTISLVFTWAKSCVMGNSCCGFSHITRTNGLARLQALAA